MRFSRHPLPKPLSLIPTAPTVIPRNALPRKRPLGRRAAIARLLLAGLLLLGAGGCTAAFNSRLLNLRATASVPLLQPEPRLPVVYPAPAGASSGQSVTVEELYGPAWQDLQPQYPGLRFN